jgi:hypothetical protein
MIKAFREAFAEWWWGPLYRVEVRIFWPGEARPMRATYRGIRGRSRAKAAAAAVRATVRDAEYIGDWTSISVEADRA